MYSYPFVYYDQDGMKSVLCVSLSSCLSLSTLSFVRTIKKLCVFYSASVSSCLSLCPHPFVHYDQQGVCILYCLSIGMSVSVCTSFDLL